MSDIVERLRDWMTSPERPTPPALLESAAREIEKQDAVIVELQALVNSLRAELEEARCRIHDAHEHTGRVQAELEQANARAEKAEADRDAFELELDANIAHLQSQLAQEQQAHAATKAKWEAHDCLESLGWEKADSGYTDNALACSESVNPPFGVAPRTEP